MSSTNNSRHAFTLVELLVVIAIIGILIGMLLPSRYNTQSELVVEISSSGPNVFDFDLTSDK